MTWNVLSSNEKRIKKHISIGLDLIVILILTFMISKPANIDDIVLVEKKYTNYWNYLYDARGGYREVLRSTFEISNRRNYVINSLGQIEGDGYTIESNEDGTIVFKGRNKGENAWYVFCIIDELPNGKYVYDDGVDNSGITSYVEGINYRIGGAEERERLNDVFTTVFSRYQCKIEIESGFEGEVVFKPMLRAVGDSNGNYEPCLTKSITVSDPVGYYVLQATPWNLKDITSADLRHLERTVTSAYPNAEWVTVSIGDGYGIQIDADDNNIVFGRLDHMGRIMDKDICDISDDSIIAQWPKTLRDTTCFVTYLKRLKMENRTFIISIKDDGVSRMKYAEKDALQKLGCESDFSDKVRYSYIAVFEQGECKYEEFSQNRLELNGVFSDGSTYNIISGGYNVGSISSIVINGQEYSMNRRGMNIVVVEDGKVIDTVAFDTNFDMFAYRDKSFLVNQ